MLIRKPLAIAVAALSLACAGNAAAQTDVLVVEGTSVGILSHAPVARDPAAPTPPAEPIGLLVPAVQKVREAAARTESELTLQERAAAVGANRSMTVGGNQSETVKAAPATPHEDMRLKSQKILQNAPAPVPQPVAPQRSPFAGGASNTLMIGEKHGRPALLPGAPGVGVRR